MYEHFLLLSSKYSLSDGKHSYIENEEAILAAVSFAKGGCDGRKRNFVRKIATAVYIYIYDVVSKLYNTFFQFRLS